MLHLPGGKIGGFERDGAIHEIGIRPEHLRFISTDTTDGLSGTVLTTENLGSDTFTFVNLPDFDRSFLVRSEGAKPMPQGAQVRVSFDPSAAHLFATDGRALALPSALQRAMA
jgi:ABC-type sugar transport system ATPase subunit